MKKLTIFLLPILLILVTACSPAMLKKAETNTERPRGMMGKIGESMGPGSGMMARHHATIPAEYAEMSNPVTADAESLARGAEIYSAQCATCHGDGGMGDGPAGVSLDPAPAAIAHTGQMLGADYFFWRISEGGAMEPFSSTMPSFKTALDKKARWDVINYVQALGSGQVTPRQAMGGATFDPEAEAEMRAEMLAEGVKQNLLTQEEADTFEQVHAAMDLLMASDTPKTGGMAQMQETMLAELLKTGQITQAQADAFNNIHDRLLEAGLMQ